MAYLADLLGFEYVVMAMGMAGGVVFPDSVKVSRIKQ